jgi:magnesium-transporting ATPase (P-type)
MPKKRLSSDYLVLIGMAAVFTTPFILTLMTVAQPRPLVGDLQANPTHHGYTWSLSLFIVPVVVLACWLVRRHESRIQNRAFWITTLVVASGGILLDVFFGLSFFTFPNQDAVLGIHFYGYSFADGWQKTIPIEEIGFYIFGALAVLLLYVWGDEFWFAAYNVDDAPRRTTRFREVISFHPASVFFAVLVFSLGLLYKKFGPHSDHDGFPGYFLFLTLVALTPSILFFPVARPFINWRAFSLGFVFILLVSMFWEAAIAVPYQWWSFQPRPMLGLFINGFCGLPVEEPLLWAGITWATVIIYETISTLLFMDWSRSMATDA